MICSGHWGHLYERQLTQSSWRGLQYQLPSPDVTSCKESSPCSINVGDSVGIIIIFHHIQESASVTTLHVEMLRCPVHSLTPKACKHSLAPHMLCMCLRKEAGLSAGILPNYYIYQHSTGCSLKTVCVYFLNLCLWHFWQAKYYVC